MADLELGVTVAPHRAYAVEPSSFGIHRNHGHTLVYLLQWLARSKRDWQVDYKGLLYYKEAIYMPKDMAIK